MRNFERDIKDGILGDPEALFCGLCGTGRLRVRGVMFCRACDAPGLGLLAPTWAQEPPA